MDASKYEQDVVKLLSEKPQSTNEILSKLQEQSGKVINWHAAYRILVKLASENKASKIDARAGFFWVKK